MDATTKLLTARKICDLLTSAERRSAVVLLGLMVIGMVLETLGAGSDDPGDCTAHTE